MAIGPGSIWVKVSPADFAFFIAMANAATSLFLCKVGKVEHIGEVIEIASQGEQQAKESLG